MAKSGDHPNTPLDVASCVFETGADFVGNSVAERLLEELFSILF